ncbi:MAG: hypothetical protein ACRCST_00610 [Turicibacter sp.]
MKFELTLLKNPSGTYSFVGSVPLDLAYCDKNGNKVISELVDKQLMLPSAFRIIRTRSWANASNALDEAKALGYINISVIE